MPNVVNLSCLTPEPKSHSFVDTIHGLTDKLHQLSHLGHDDDRKNKSGNSFSSSCYFSPFVLYFRIDLHEKDF